MITAPCRQCGKQYRASDDRAGKRFRCAACGGVVAVDGPARALATDPPPPGDVGLTLSPGESTAVNPARTAIDFGQYFYSYPGVPLLVLVCGLVGLVGAVASGSWWLVPVCVVGGGVRAMRALPRIQRDVRRFRLGHVNPAVVLARRGRGEPWRVAVYTDLANSGDGHRPAICVMAVPLGRMAGGPPTPGMRLAAPALYGGTATPGTWTMFEPAVANLCVRRPAALDRLVRSISADEWRSLEQYLPRLSDDRPGLYRLWPGGRPTPLPQTRPAFQYAGFGIVTAMCVAILCAMPTIKAMHAHDNDPAIPLPPPSAQPYRPQPPRPVPPERMLQADPANNADQLFRKFDLNRIAATRPAAGGGTAR